MSGQEVPASRARPAARVAVLGMGGTIASVRDASGAVPQLSTEELVAAIPGIDEYASLECRTFRMLPSTDVALPDLVDLAGEIDRLAGQGVEAVVVTHGTDTLEESAFALDLLVRSAIPVVVTGAMRHSDLPSPDGPGNLLSAVQVAASGATAGMGTVVVLDYVVHAARYVRKTNTTRLGTFVSEPAGPLGWVHEGEFHLGASVGDPPKLTPSPGATQPVVPVYTTVLGDDDTALRALADLPLDGLVVEGLGGGHIRPGLAPLVGELASRIPVVIASRTGSGQILRNTYGTVGGDIDLAQRGLLSAGYLDGLKARILLSLVVMSAEATSPRELFDHFVSAL